MDGSPKKEVTPLFFNIFFLIYFKRLFLNLYIPEKYLSLPWALANFKNLESIMNQNLIRYLKDFNNRRVFLPTINISELTIKLVCGARVFL